MIFPPFYKGGFTDAEKAFYCMLKPYCDLTDPQIELTTWRKWRDQESVVARFYRSGGVADRTTDTSIIQMTVFSYDRDLSINVSEYLRQQVLTYCGSNGVVRAVGAVAESDPDFTAAVVSAEDHMGPELFMTEEADGRFIDSAFRVTLRKPRGLPDYAAFREQIINP